MTSRTKLALALVVVVVLALAVVWATRPRPVLVQAFYPFSGHEFIVDYMKTLEKTYPGKVKVEVYNMEETEGRRMWGKTGLGCAGVFLNGRTQHTIVRPDGKKETVNFLKRMDEFWSKADFETVLKQEMKHPTPLPPGGFSIGEVMTAGAEGGKGAAAEKPASTDKPAQAEEPAKQGE